MRLLTSRSGSRASQVALLTPGRSVCPVQLNFKTEQSPWHSKVACSWASLKEHPQTRNLRIRSPTPCLLGQGGHGAGARFPCQKMLRFVFAFAHCLSSSPAHATVRSLVAWRIESFQQPEDRIMTPVGFEPTLLALVELESTPLDHSGKESLSFCSSKNFCASAISFLSVPPRGSIHKKRDAQ